MTSNSRAIRSPASRDNTASSRRLWAVVGLVVVFGWPYVLLLAGVSPSLASRRSDLAVIVAEWVVAFVLAVLGFGLLRRKGGFFGFRTSTVRDVLWMLAVLVATYLVSGLAAQLLRVQTSRLGVQELAAVPFWLKLGLVLTAGICEEFMFRGFAIEELTDWSGSLWLGALIAWLGFTFAHIGRYGFSASLVIPAVAGGGLTLLYVWRRNLYMCMVMHAAIDGFAIFLLPFLIRGGPH